MKELSANQKLDELISITKTQQAQQLLELKQQFEKTYDSFKPVNILKSNWMELKNTPHLKEQLLPTILGISGGFITNKLVSITTKNPILKILGSALQYFVSNYITKHTENNTAT